MRKQNKKKREKIYTGLKEANVRLGINPTCRSRRGLG